MESSALVGRQNTGPCNQPSCPQLFLELGWSVCLCRRPLSLVRNDDLTVARVDHEDGEKLGRFRVAGIVAHLVMITRLLRPALAQPYRCARARR
jgi:hypothetical protein